MMTVRKILMKIHVIEIVNVKSMSGPRTRLAAEIPMKSNFPSIIANEASTLAIMFVKSAIIDPSSRKKVLLKATKI